ncbi:MAG: hypothetical protein H0V56_00055 [Chthoniobacterales bacterium]|nr:hypothetical protein [Chthoniobacterales bacterium]
METRPEKSFKPASFSTHAARGIIRDPQARKKAMFALLFLAVLMVIAGSSVLQGFLDPRAHTLRFILFWLGCAWLTITAMLLALFDALMARKRARAAQRRLREELLRAAAAEPPSGEKSP